MQLSKKLLLVSALLLVAAKNTLASEGKLQESKKNKRKLDQNCAQLLSSATAQQRMQINACLVETTDMPNETRNIVLDYYGSDADHVRSAVSKVLMTDKKELAPKRKHAYSFDYPCEGITQELNALRTSEQFMAIQALDNNLYECISQTIDEYIVRQRWIKLALEEREHAYNQEHAARVENDVADSNAGLKKANKRLKKVLALKV